jgi:hypothetical protein
MMIFQVAAPVLSHHRQGLRLEFSSPLVIDPRTPEDGVPS